MITPSPMICFSDIFSDQNQTPETRDLLAKGKVVELPANQVVFHQGDPCERYILVFEGQVKVILNTSSGREVLLYHVCEGESCVLTTSCLIAGDKYPADGITETVVKALLFERAPFDQALEESAIFRRFVFSNLGKRFTEVISKLEQVKFEDIDSRLATLLLHNQEQMMLKTTHQALSTEIGSAREVVSRHLKIFESQGWIRLGRGVIVILDPKGLENLLH